MLDGKGSEQAVKSTTYMIGFVNVVLGDPQKAVLVLVDAHFTVASPTVITA